MLEISLIGEPHLSDDGELTDRLRGRKAWALLGRLVRSDRPVARRQLVDELFSEANDPMGALRWTLAELRRKTGLADSFNGDPVRLDFPDWVQVDVASIGELLMAGRIPSGEFLAGIDIAGSESFDSWLMIERQRVDAEVLAAIRQAALRALSTRDHALAIDLGRSAVERAPFEEAAHILLIKALAASGDTASAEKQVAACCELWARELGIEPSAAVAAAARPGVADPVPGVSSAASAVSLLHAGLAALSAGAVDAGVECLRRSTAEAEKTSDVMLHARTLVELGTALVHSVRGYDDEGSVILAAAYEAAKQVGNTGIAAKALTEMGYVEAQAGRRTNAAGYLTEAESLADGDAAALAAIVGFDAINLNDWGRPEQSIARFEEALELSRRADARRREIWVSGVGGMALFHAGRVDDAGAWLESAIALCDLERWTAFKPWPIAWMGKWRLAAGVPSAEIRAEMEANLALSTQIGDPCWEAVSAEAIGATYRATGEYDLAIGWMEQGRALCRRVSDSYAWFEGHLLLTTAQTALEAGYGEKADALARELVIHAARRQMDGLMLDATRIIAGSTGPTSA